METDGNCAKQRRNRDENDGVPAHDFALEFASSEPVDEAWLTAHLLSKSQPRRTEDLAGAFCLDEEVILGCKISLRTRVHHETPR